MSDHDLHSLAHVGEAHRPRSFFAPIDHDRAVQHRRTDFQFLAANAHERLSICRDIKIVWKNSVGRRGRELRVADRKSTRLNSSHTVISYAVFCLKKKKKKKNLIVVNYSRMHR